MFLQNLKDVLADLIPKEQTRIKNFKQQYGKTNIGQVTVDMVSDSVKNRIVTCVKGSELNENHQILLIHYINSGSSM